MTETIFKTLDLDISIVSAVRLGKKSTKPRPLMIKLGNKSEMLSVLKVKRKLRAIYSFKHIFIGADLTITQRTQYNDIKRQLEEKKRSGDSGWFIKFVNGAPTLAKKNSEM